MRKQIRTEPKVKSEVISVYIPSELKKQAEAAAKRQGRKLSQFVRWAVELEVAEERSRRRHESSFKQTREYQQTGGVGFKLKPGLFEE